MGLDACRSAKWKTNEMLQLRWGINHKNFFFLWTSER